MSSSARSTVAFGSASTSVRISVMLRHSMPVGQWRADERGRAGGALSGGKDEYLARFTRALDAAIAAGHIVPEDRQEIRAIAAIDYDAAP